MTTISDAVAALKARTGEPVGTTKHGSFWMPLLIITNMKEHFDAITEVCLEGRHYRDGAVRVFLTCTKYKDDEQSQSHHNESTIFIDLTEEVGPLSYAEDVIALLQCKKINGVGAISHDQIVRDEVIDLLYSVGIEKYRPSPDES